MNLGPQACILLRWLFTMRRTHACLLVLVSWASLALHAQSSLVVNTISPDLSAKIDAVAQLALAWVLRDARMTSALIGASQVEQVEQNVAALGNLRFTSAELAKIDAILAPARA